MSNIRPCTVIRFPLILVLTFTKQYSPSGIWCRINFLLEKELIIFGKES